MNKSNWVNNNSKKFWKKGLLINRFKILFRNINLKIFSMFLVNSISKGSWLTISLICCKDFLIIYNLLKLNWVAISVWNYSLILLCYCLVAILFAQIAKWEIKNVCNAKLIFKIKFKMLNSSKIWLVSFK